MAAVHAAQGVLRGPAVDRDAIPVHQLPAEHAVDVLSQRRLTIVDRLPPNRGGNERAQGKPTDAQDKRREHHEDAEERERSSDPLDHCFLIGRALFLLQIEPLRAGAFRLAPS